jgi:hypothetical protein
MAPNRKPPENNKRNNITAGSIFKAGLKLLGLGTAVAFVSFLIIFIKGGVTMVIKTILDIGTNKIAGILAVAFIYCGYLLIKYIISEESKIQKHWKCISIVALCAIIIIITVSSGVGWDYFINHNVFPSATPTNTITPTPTLTHTPTNTPTFTPILTNTPTSEEEIQKTIGDFYAFLSNGNVDDAYNLFTGRKQGKVWKQDFARDWSGRTAEIIRFEKPKFNINRTDKTDCTIIIHVYYRYSVGPVEEYNVLFYMQIENGEWKIDEYSETLIVTPTPTRG